MNESMNDEAVYRTAPATPGLLNIYILKFIVKYCKTLASSETILGISMSKVQEKRSMSKTNFFMMKYERTKGYEMVFTVFKPNFGFGANLGQQLK